MRIPALAMAATVCGSAVLFAQGPPQEVFRAATHAVGVDVAVFDGDRVVSTLGPANFEVFDNGVRQAITSVDYNVLPIDLKLVFDTSGSITPAELDRYQRAMSRVAEALTHDDRCEILTFNGSITDAARRQNPPIAIAVTRVGREGTSFFDAVSLAMVTVPRLDRRQITVVLSDASDNTSFFDEATLLDAARRTDAVVYTILPASQSSVPTPFAARLQALSVITGGRLVRAQRDSRMSQLIIDAIDEFRHSYVVRYMRSGNDARGWHTLTVTVRGRHGYSVRAKQGYFSR